MNRSRIYGSAIARGQLNDTRGRPAGARAALLAFVALLALALLPAGARAVTPGAIAGEVTDAGTNAPLQGIEACAARGPFFGPSTCEETGAGGEYEISGLEPGTYKVQFRVPGGSALNYLSQYFDGQGTLAKATPVTVAEAAVTGSVDAAMQAGGRIAGTITDDEGHSLEEFRACAYSGQQPEAVAGCAASAADGSYTINSLPSGSYKVGFEAASGEFLPGHFGRLNYVTQYHDGRSSRADADPVAVTAGSTSGAIDAVMEEGAIVVGTVTDESAAPLAGVLACAYPADSSSESAGCGTSDSSGEYGIAGLATGSYKLRFTPFLPAGKYESEYYAGKSTFGSADAVAVTAGATKSGVDASLLERGKLSGTVTASGGGALAGISVCASATSIVEGGFGCATTDGSGDFTLSGLPAGKYLVKFEGGLDYIDQYFDGTEDQSESTLVTIAAGTTMGSVDAELQPAGKIEGTVLDAVTEAPLQGIEVCPQKPTGVSSVPCVQTDGAGHYTVGGLAAGSYLVRFQRGFQPANADYLGQYFDGKGARPEATQVTVAAGATAGPVDAEMRKGARIAGSVTSEGGSPLEAIQVCASPARGGQDASNCANSDAGGHYAITGIPAGDYKVRFGPGFADGYLSQYYDDKPTRKLATVVHAGAAGVVSGIDATLHPGGTIAGRITDAETSDPLAFYQACASKLGSELAQRCAQTDADGEYTIKGLASGSYEVRFGGQSPNSPYLPERYDDQPAAGPGTPVAVTAGATVSGIDAGLDRGGAISGETTDATTHLAAPSIRVCPLRDGEVVGECAVTDNAGRYSLEGLPTGDYVVRFSPGAAGWPGPEPSNPRYVTEYYDGHTDSADAEPVAVAAGAEATGVDAEMDVGGGIAGTITGPGGEPVRHAEACIVLGSESEPFRCGTANASGDYEIVGLASGAYKVRFAYNGPDRQSDLLPEYFDDEESASSAAEVNVAGTATTPSVDAQLHAGGAIEGLVTAAADGLPISGAFVCAIVDGETEPFRCAEAEADGSYRIGALPTDDYEVEFSVSFWEEGEGIEEIFTKQYFPGASSLGAASPVAVTAGSTTGSIDASMVEADTSATFSVARAGSGAGTVSSSPAGILCGAACSAQFPAGTHLTLTASPAPGSVFEGWRGACSGAGACQLTLFGAASAEAVFGLAATPPPPAPPSTAPPHRPRQKKPRCRKGLKPKKVRGKWRCVRRHGRKHHRGKHRR